MAESILTSVKKDLGIMEDYTHFDPDIINDINSVFSVLTQIGVGPTTGFAIEDKNAVWEDFITDYPRLSFVKSYVSKRVRMLFDPPLSSSVKEAVKEVIDELEWRISVAVDPGQTAG